MNVPNQCERQYIERSEVWKSVNVNVGASSIRVKVYVMSWKRVKCEPDVTL